MTMIKGVNKNVRELVKDTEADGIEVDVMKIKTWINDITDSIDKTDLCHVVAHLMSVEHTRENLLEVYSYVNECYERLHSVNY